MMRLGELEEVNVVSLIMEVNACGKMLLFEVLHRGRISIMSYEVYHGVEWGLSGVWVGFGWGV